MLTNLSESAEGVVEAYRSTLLTILNELASRERSPEAARAVVVLRAVLDGRPAEPVAAPVRVWISRFLPPLRQVVMEFAVLDAGAENLAAVRELERRLEGVL